MEVIGTSLAGEPTQLVASSIRLHDLKRGVAVEPFPVTSFVYSPVGGCDLLGDLYRWLKKSVLDVRHLGERGNGRIVLF